eukprot:CAMPEP_0202711476 /NCGR_PEP_ID=MMETSP1385-20130828/23278_1 /ASSEMBLY_ACC=CAM_ASM_000861 /TAXON_ID=933848 /ORGANISM="Elphidium margaritaceum" /LENGTH=600 /DNA_ID=CAMNT_0049371223 /DNA_START=1 /DNA_END=1800 /DNA_ORIENTATION=-
MSALDGALCWSCGICTFNNPLQANECAMCANPRPEEQYQQLLQIQEDARRQRRVQEEYERQLAVNSNRVQIQQQSNVMSVDDEEEAAKKLLATDDGNDWNDADFDDADDWDDNTKTVMDTSTVDVDAISDDCEIIEVVEEVEVEVDADADNDDDDENGWSDTELNVQHIDSDMKVPEKIAAYEILRPRELREYQSKFVKEVAEELYMADLEDVLVLARFYRWNKNELLDEYLADTQQVLQKSGVVSSDAAKHQPQESGTFFCMLCVTEYTNCAQSTFAPAQCGHQYCQQCWSSYLEAQMEKGPRCVQTKCIEPSCKLTLRSSVLERLLPYKHLTKYKEYVQHSFVSGRSNLQWCPGKECVNAVKAEFGAPLTIDCDSCCHSWCFACLNEAHLPCTCELADRWLRLHASDSENVTWVRAFTKQCPKCKNHIEKNQGCNHMTCRCGYEFCWLCRKDWKKIGYGHQCNKPQDVVEAENAQKSAESYLKRYMFYFARYEAHEKSAQIAHKTTLENARECIRTMITDKAQFVKQYKYGDLQFIEDAIREVIHCKNILQWSYCFGYYLAEQCDLKQLFETQQGLLESFSDQLHEKAEKPVDDSAQW